MGVNNSIYIINILLLRIKWDNRYKLFRICLVNGKQYLKVNYFHLTWSLYIHIFTNIYTSLIYIIDFICIFNTANSSLGVLGPSDACILLHLYSEVIILSLGAPVPSAIQYKPYAAQALFCSHFHVPFSLYSQGWCCFPTKALAILIWQQPCHIL